jgi:UDP-GlcNAc:undecaprenyl-phosphate/decaprenyl-phosphate GlcNAc-1-phosphate transferase
LLKSVAVFSLSQAQIPGFLIALVLSLCLVPWICKKALAAGFTDIPDDRKIHRVPVPRLGGVAVWLAFMIALGAILLLSGFPHPKGNSLWGILTGGTMIFTLGLIDDLVGLSPYVKLLGQFAAAAVAFAMGVQINTLDLPGSMFLMLKGLAFPVTLLWIVALSNAMNFIDGVDGLASGVVTFSSITLVIVALFTNQPVAALLAALLAGANLGFLTYNFHPARIFMGDSGALFSGFLLASIAVTGVLKTPIVVMLLPIVVLSVPIIDITYSTLRRLFRGQNPFLPDADHIHHRLLKAGFSQVRTVLALYGVCLISGVIASSYVNLLGNYLIIMTILIGLSIGLILAVRRFYPANQNS